jgi:NADH:ubiquinone oxidoreductase subunit E
MVEEPMGTTLDKIIEEYQGKPGEIISVLEKIQEVYGYLPQEVLKEVSEKLQVHLSQLFSLATFYSAFTLKPRGEHIVHVCLGTACHVRGAPKIVDELSRLLGIKPSDTTEDMKFTLETVRCIGCCSLAPVLKVDKDIYGYNTMDKMPKILANYKG